MGGGLMGDRSSGGAGRGGGGFQRGRDRWGGVGDGGF